MEIIEVSIEKPEGINFILGQTHFIKSVEDIYEAILNTVPHARFGLAFCEASGPCLIRSEGNDNNLMELARKNAENIAAGHSFIIIMDKCFPLNILPALKRVPEVCNIFCATANPTIVLLVERPINGEKGRGIIGVIDGFKSKGTEKEKDIIERKSFLRKIGYKR
jgi:adenosine/AMP kinase